MLSKQYIYLCFLAAVWLQHPVTIHVWDRNVSPIFFYYVESNFTIVL